MKVATEDGDATAEEAVGLKTWCSMFLPVV